MKKLIKVCLVAGLVCVFVGGGITAAAAVMGGTMAVKHYEKSYAGSDFWLNVARGVRHWSGWDADWFDWDEDWNDWDGYTEDVSYSFTAKEVSFSDIRELELTGAVGTVEIVSGGEQGQFNFKFEDENFYDCYKDGDKLEIKKNKNVKIISGNHTKQGNITLTVPEGYHFRKAELEIDAGDMIADVLNADSAELEAKAGEIRIESGTIGKLSADSKAGSIYCRANVTGNVEADCDAGSVELLLSGKQEDFNYEIKSQMSDVMIGTNTYSGMNFSKDINNSASKNMELDCSAGEITVNFES